jgi:hypothetical protein
MKKAGVIADLRSKLAAIEVLSKQRNLPNFGNGGAVANLLSRALLRKGQREASIPVANRNNVLVAADFDAPSSDNRNIDDETLFADLIGCDEVIKVLKEYKSTLIALQKKGQDPFSSGVLECNFRFVGSPGTGKTTVARRMGKMFCSLGILQSDEVVERSASDLVTGFVGQAAKVTRQVKYIFFVIILCR